MEGPFHAFTVQAVAPSQLMANTEIRACRFFECAFWYDEGKGFESGGVKWLGGECVGSVSGCVGGG